MRPWAWCSFDLPSGLLLVPCTGHLPHLAGWLALWEGSQVCAHSSFQRDTQVQAGFIPSKSSGIQVLDGGGPDAHVITFAQTYTTQTMDGSLRWSQRNLQTWDTTAHRHTGTHS